ncbi:MAG: hypothetical protein E7290_04670 [Lachnospiraceae bacterium]|nr:hypothetical protein [Lachnospiraceae bacterium]
METKEYWKEGIDSKEYLICFLFQLRKLILIGVAGAVIGSGLYLLIMMIAARVPVYQSETVYYIDFAEGRIDAKDYYNDFTWNTVIGSDLILGRVVEQLPGHERSVVKDMITADILSDVRYLTITVQGEDAAQVEEITLALEEALVYFGTEFDGVDVRDTFDSVVKIDVSDTFDSIVKIEDSGVNKVVQPLFTWRAVFLGFVIGFFVAWFVFSVKFAVADAFYTRGNIERYLGITALGIRYRQGKKASSANVQTEETRDGVILLIPFGESCRRRTEDMMRDLKIQGRKVVGAVLIEADAKWMKLYYGALGGEECD